ncbi:MAG: hypothetical protein K6F61_04175 [Clostridiales bacterium]|nr:hypothetical protein [Clostridiales bacterium]
MTVLRVNAINEHVFPRQRNASQAFSGRGYYPAARGWSRDPEFRGARRHDVIMEKRRPLPPFSREGIRRDVIIVTLSLLLVLFLCVLTADINAVLSGNSRVGRLSVGISSLEEHNGLLRRQITRAESMAFTTPQSGSEDPGRTVLLALSFVPEE